MRGSNRRARPGLGRCLSQVLVGDGRHLEPPNDRRPKPCVCRGHARLILHTFKRRRQRPGRQIQPMHLANNGILGNAKRIRDFSVAIAARMQFAQPINHAGFTPWARMGAHGWRLRAVLAFSLALARCSAASARFQHQSPSFPSRAETARHIAALIISSPPPKSPLLLWRRQPNPTSSAADRRVQLP